MKRRGGPACSDGVDRAAGRNSSEQSSLINQKQRRQLFLLLLLFSAWLFNVLCRVALLIVTFDLLIWSCQEDRRLWVSPRWSKRAEIRGRGAQFIFHGLHYRWQQISSTASLSWIWAFLSSSAASLSSALLVTSLFVHLFHLGLSQATVFRSRTMISFRFDVTWKTCFI